MSSELIIMLLLVDWTLCQVKNNGDEYCMDESFQPQCSKNDIILMKNATYGRMKIGRCLTSEEVDTHKIRVGDDPSYFGCSVNVLDILDQRCSGKTSCDVRVFGLQGMGNRPCAPGLMTYLEATYDCITAVDEKRSCVIKTSMAPTHIISSSADQRICGSKFQPWLVESPTGQKISVALIDLSLNRKQDQTICRRYGAIVDKVGNRNISICGNKDQRQRKLYLSNGNALEIYLSAFESTKTQDNEDKFIIKLETIGCSDIVPPEDTWLKRKDDAVVIGCYSTRQTWQLSCNEGKWIGVLGNCSANREFVIGNANSETETIYTIAPQEQVLAIVAISGCTFAVCLIIVCIGTVCLRKFYIRYKAQGDYKSLILRHNQDLKQHVIRRIASAAGPEALEADERSFDSKLCPTYSVYVEGNNFSDDKNASNSFINGINQ